MVPWFLSINYMFTSPRPNLYESSEGFSVEVLGRTGICYREGAKKLFVDSEVLMGSEGMGIYKSSIKHWKSPAGAEDISDEERDHIVENIREAFRFQGFDPSSTVSESGGLIINDLQ